MSNNNYNKEECQQPSKVEEISSQLTSMGSADKATLFLRIFAGVILFTQAISKSQEYPLISDDYPPILGLSSATVVSIVGIVEVIAGVLLTIGLFTRITAVVMTVVALSALFLFPLQTFDQSELKFVYAGIYVTLAISGGGRYSLDNLVDALRGRKSRM